MMMTEEGQGEMEENKKKKKSERRAERKSRDLQR